MFLDSEILPGLFRGEGVKDGIFLWGGDRYTCLYPLAFFFRVLPSLGYQAPVVQKLDSAIHGINHYPVDKC